MGVVVVVSSSGSIVHVNSLACAFFGGTKLDFEALHFRQLFPSPYCDLYDRGKEFLLSSVVEVKKFDNSRCPVILGMRETMHLGALYLVFMMKEFVPCRAIIVLLPEGTISEVVNANSLGFSGDELIGKSILATLPYFRKVLNTAEKGTVNHVFSPYCGQPILTSLRVTRATQRVNLEFEIIDGWYDVRFATSGDGVIKDCSNYSVEQITGYTKEQLLGQSMNVVVPFLFPIAPMDVKISCEARHKEGHFFHAKVILRRTGAEAFCCQLRRRVAECSEADNSCFGVEIPNVRLGALLGLGGTSVVRLGKLKGSLQVSAIKVIENKDAGSALEEAEILKALNHQCIPKLHFVVNTPTHVAVAMEFCQGIELGHYLPSKGSLLICDGESKHYFRQLASAVAYIHNAGVIHRDIKLENVIVYANDTAIHWHGNTIKLIDFGFSCKFQPGVMQDSFCGTLSYASPEVLMCLPYCGPDADIWAMGVLLYAMSLGCFPFANAKDAVLAPVNTRAIQSPYCASLISQMLAKNVTDRLTIAGVVSHPWLENSDRSGHDENAESNRSNSARKRCSSSSIIEEVALFKQSRM